MSGRQIAETWLGDVISNLGYEVHRQPAPIGTPYPHVTISLRGGIDVRPTSEPATVERLTYDISVWKEGFSAAPLWAISEAIKSAIEGVPPLTISEGTVVSCRRIGVVPVDSFVENGEHIMRDGYIYQVMTLET